MKIVFIANNYPPAVCGVGDYTYCLLQELAKRGFELKVLKLDTSVYANIRKIKPDLVSIQYTPSLYMSACLGLGLIIFAFWAGFCGIKCITTFHERYRDLSLNPKLALLSLIQRIGLFFMIIASESVIFCAEHWVRDYRRYFFWLRKKIYYLSVGSNIPYVSLSQEQRRRKRSELGAKDETIILGTFGKVENFINKFYFDNLLSSSESLERKGYDVILLLIGWPAKESRLYFPYKDRIAPDDIKPLGRLPASGVCEYLNIVDIYLAPFDEGLTARKGTVMAAIQQGLPVISTIGAKTDNIFNSCGAIKLVAAQKQLFLDALIDLVKNRQERILLGKAAKVFYEKNFSWVRIADEFMKIAGN